MGGVMDEVLVNVVDVVDDAVAVEYAKTQEYLLDHPGVVESGISPVFEGQSPFFICDDEWLAETMTALGLRAAHITTAPDPMPESIVLFWSDFANLPTYGALLASMRHSRLFWMPIASFDGTKAAALYALRMLLATDFEQMVDRNRDIMSLLASTSGPYVFTGEGTSVSFSLDENVPLASRTRLSLKPSESTSLGFYTEVGMSMAVPDLVMPYHVNGEFVAQGVLFARQRQSPPELDWLFARGEQAVEAIKRDLLPMKIDIVDNRFSPDCLRDLKEVIYWTTNADYDWRISEFAFGTNVVTANMVDWSYNSQFNEGVGGLHIALGDGRTGIHIDFICPGGQLKVPGSGSISGFEP